MRRLLLALVLVAGCTSTESHPREWFAPLPPDVKPYSWEITPEKAGEGEVILSKRTELGVFSNFAATPFELDGVRYASLEGLWQSLYYPETPEDPRAKKGEWPRTRAEIRALTAFEAKRAGDDAKKLLRADGGAALMSYQGRFFDPRGTPEERAFHLALIERATRAKVDQNPQVRALLLRTGTLRLRPDHDQGPEATDAYRYFDILMRIRDELRKAS